MTKIHTDTLIIGAGISGLTIANQLHPHKECIILEKENVPGGLSTTYLSEGFRFDYSGHYFHFQGFDEIKSYLETFSEFKSFNRQSKTALLNHLIPFPVQFHLSYLPSTIRQRIYNEMMNPPLTTSRFNNLNDFLYNHFGPTLYELFFKPFLTKYYLSPLDYLASQMDRGSIPVPDKEQVKDGFHGKRFSKAGYNAVIYYPRSYLHEFVTRYSNTIEPYIHLNEEVIEIHPVQRMVKTRDNTYYYDKLVSTMPLNHLIEKIKPLEKFEHFREPGLLKYVSTLLVNVILKEKRRRFHWVYLAEKQFPFYRAGMYALHPFPACYLERNILPGASFDYKTVFHETAFTLKKLKIIESPYEIVHLDTRIIPVSYIIFDTKWSHIVPPLLEELKKEKIYSIGRYGSWNYSFMSFDIRSAMHMANDLRC